MKKFIMTVAVAGLLAIAGSASAATFVYTGGIIKVGSHGTHIADLQNCMNSLGYSTGFADGQFGQMTKAGVMAFQASKGLFPDGIIGPKTGPQFTAACATVDGGSSTTLPDGCTSTMGYSSTTGEKCDGSDSSTTLPEGCTSTVGYSPLTGEKCDGSDSSSTTMGTSGEEASLSNYNLKAGSDDTIREGEKEEVARIEFDVDDADFALERVDLTFDYTGTAAGEDKPWKAFKKVILKADGKEIASKSVDDQDDWKEDQDPYVLRLTDISYIVKAGDKAKLSVEVEADDSVDGTSSASNNTWDIYVDTDGIRGVDEAGISQFIGDAQVSPMVHDKESFNIEDEAAGEALTIKSSSNNPDATIFKVYDDKTSDDYKVFAFKLDADEHNIKVDHLVLTFNTTGVDLNSDGDTTDAGEAAVYDDVVDDVYVKIDGTKYDDVSVTNGNTGTATLDFDIDKDAVIDADTSENVYVYAKFREQSASTYPAGTTVSVDTASVTGEGVDDVSDSTVINGDTHTLELGVPKVTLLSKTSSLSDDQKVATFSFEVKVEAEDEDISFDKASDVVKTVIGPNDPLDGSTSVSAGNAVKISGDASLSGTTYTVLAGEDATFAVDVTIDPVAADLGVYRVELTSFAGETLEEIAGPETITVA